MHAVVLYPIDADPDLPGLARLFGLTAWDLRPRVRPPGPAIVEVLADAEPAQARSAALREAGVGHFILSEAILQRRDRPFQVRAVELTDDALRVRARDGTERALPYSQLRLGVVAMRARSSVHVEETTEKKFSASRTLVSGGLLNSRTVTRRHERVQEDRERLLTLIATEGAPLALGELGLQVEGLPATVSASGRAATFTWLLAALRQRAPGAPFDSRLLQRAGQVALLGPRLEPEQYLELAIATLERALLGE